MIGLVTAQRSNVTNTAMTARIPTLFFLFLILSCSSISRKNTENNLRNIRVGMSEQSVIEVLGKPDSKTGQAWLYTIVSSDKKVELPYKLIMVNSKLTEIRFDTDKANEIQKYIDSTNQTDCGLFSCGSTPMSNKHP
jgi:outer membrane protein assembly factor BamE (lipoprotein component of BamABCDE complex)